MLIIKYNCLIHMLLPIRGTKKIGGMLGKKRKSRGKSENNKSLYPLTI